jgi:LPS export ABC transporter protein LptC
MKFFLKRFSIIVLIVLLAALLGYFSWSKSNVVENPQDKLLIKVNEKIESVPAEEILKTEAYLEKIDDFSLQEFDKNQKIVNFIKAKQYFNYKNDKTVLVKPNIIFYTPNGKKSRILNANYLRYAQDGAMLLEGDVHLDKYGKIAHKIKAKTLRINAKQDDLSSKQAVVYFSGLDKISASKGLRVQSDGKKVNLLGKVFIQGANGKNIKTRNLLIDQRGARKRYFSKYKTLYISEFDTIHAGGLDAKNNLTHLLGKVNIVQRSGIKIKTKHLSIDQTKGKAVYYSKNTTVYTSPNNTVRAKNGMNMDTKKQKINLWGAVKITQKSGATIDTQDLLIDQSDNNEIYQTQEKIHYRSEFSDIQAVGMQYDGKKQRIELTGGVVGRYE